MRGEKIPSIDNDPLNVDAIVKHYDALRLEWAELRRRKRPQEARRLVEKFDQTQRLRANVAAQKSDPNDTRAFLVLLATQLRDGRKLPHEVRQYLSDALTETAKNPAVAAAAFGLARPNHRPRTTEFRDVSIAFRIAELSASMPINLASEGQSAIATAALAFGVSDSVAERAWKKQGRFAVGWMETMKFVGKELPRS